ncbi:MAG: BON domain-containing protein [Planctomycetaceae bacterium]
MSTSNNILPAAAGGVAKCPRLLKGTSGGGELLMGNYRKWVLTLGMMAAVPSVATAGDFSLLNNQSAQQTVAPRSNQQVAEEIGDALRKAKLNGFDIDIQFQGGVATLKGKIQSAKQKQTATNVLKRINGVQQVDNQLEVIQVAKKSMTPAFRANKGQIQQTAGTMPADPIAHNQEMAQKIANELGKSGLNGYDIEVRYQDGRAQLGGFVGSPTEARQAHIVASNVDGVHQVVNSLQVKSQGQPAGRPGGMPGGMPSGMHGGMPGGMPHQVNPASFQGAPQMMPIAPQGGMPPAAAGAVYNGPNLPEYAWPAQAAYPNYAAIQYPTEYSASAWPYIGPFYPYPQVPWDGGKSVWNGMTDTGSSTSILKQTAGTGS